MHDGVGRTAQQRAPVPAQAAGRRAVAEKKDERQSRQRKNYRQHDGEVYARRRVAVHPLETHRRHRGVVQARNSHAAQKDARGQRARPTYTAAAQDCERRGGADDAHQQREQNGGPVVQHRNRQAERHHARVVHRPRADAVRRGPAQKPREPDPTARVAHALVQFARGVCAEDRDEDGERDQTVVVRAGHHHV